MCNCNHCGWQTAALADISCAGNNAHLSNNRTVSSAWRDYYASRRPCGCNACRRCGNCGCCKRCG